MKYYHGYYIPPWLLKMATTITSKGQVTIPKKVRDHLGVKPGDRLEFHIDETGNVHLEPGNKSIRALKGILPRPERTLSLEEMDEAIARGASRK